MIKQHIKRTIDIILSLLILTVLLIPLNYLYTCISDGGTNQFYSIS